MANIEALQRAIGRPVMQQSPAKRLDKDERSISGIPKGSLADLAIA
jgi:hypothetical protein